MGSGVLLPKFRCWTRTGVRCILSVRPAHSPTHIQNTFGARVYLQFEYMCWVFAAPVVSGPKYFGDEFAGSSWSTLLELGASPSFDYTDLPFGELLITSAISYQG